MHGHWGIGPKFTSTKRTGDVWDFAMPTVYWLLFVVVVRGIYFREFCGCTHWKWNYNPDIFQRNQHLGVFTDPMVAVDYSKFQWIEWIDEMFLKLLIINNFYIYSTCSSSSSREFCEKVCPGQYRITQTHAGNKKDLRTICTRVTGAIAVPLA